MDTYQPIYDAIRSKISSCDVGGAIESVFRDVNIGHYVECGMQEISTECTRPFVLMRPAMSLDGDQFCFLYGENIQEGVVGFGDTPHQASINFDHNWYNSQPPILKKDAAKSEELFEGTLDALNKLCVNQPQHGDTK